MVGVSKPLIPIFLVIMKQETHCVKSVLIRNFFWSVFSRNRAEYEDLRSKSRTLVLGHFSRNEKNFKVRIQRWVKNLQKVTLYIDLITRLNLFFLKSFSASQLAYKRLKDA